MGVFYQTDDFIVPLKLSKILKFRENKKEGAMGSGFTPGTAINGFYGGAE